MAAYPWAKLWFKVLNDTRIRRAHRADGHADALGIWTALIMLAKRCNRNGVLEDGDGKIRESDVADILALPVAVVRQNLARFVRWHAEDDGWIAVAEDGTITLPKFKKMQESESLDRTRRYLARQKERQGKSQIDGQVDGGFDAKKPRSLEGLDAGESEKPKERSKTTSSHPAKPGKADAVQEVFDFWRITMNHPRAGLDAKRKATIGRALASYSVDDCKQAIVGCSLTPHNMGQNDRNERYDGIDLILRDAAHVDRFMANATKPPESARSPADYRALDRAAEREWQRVMQSGQSNDYQKIGFAVAMLHPRTIAALKVIDKDPANAVWKMADIPIREQLTYKAAFLPAWKASRIPYEVDE